MLVLLLSLFPLSGVASPDHGLSSISQCRRDLCQGLCQGLVVHLWIRGLTRRVGMRLVYMARSLLVAVSPPFLPILGGKGAMGVGTPDVLQSSASSPSSSAVFQVGVVFKFFINGEALHLTGLCLIWFGLTIFSLGPSPLFCNCWQFNVKAATAHHPIIQMGWMSCLLREQLNHLLVVMVFVLACLWFLSILVASGPYLT